MSGGLTPCRQLRPSSRREQVSASRVGRLSIAAIRSDKVRNISWAEMDKQEILNKP